MVGVRFNTDQALFESFPSAVAHIKTEPVGAHPLVFLKDLMSGNKWEEAISFCAYLLPRRESVAWGCRSLGGKPGEQGPGASALQAAATWVDVPTEAFRCAAYDLWRESDKKHPAHWLALGAAWSGGRLAPDLENSMPAPPHLTATMVRLAFLLVLPQIEPRQKPAQVGAWIELGVQLAEHGL